MWEKIRGWLMKRKREWNSHVHRMADYKVVELARDKKLPVGTRILGRLPKRWSYNLLNRHKPFRLTKQPADSLIYKQNIKKIVNIFGISLTLYMWNAYARVRKGALKIHFQNTSEKNANDCNERTRNK